MIFCFTIVDYYLIFYNSDKKKTKIHTFFFKIEINIKQEASRQSKHTHKHTRRKTKKNK